MVKAYSLTPAQQMHFVTGHRCGPLTASVPTLNAQEISPDEYARISIPKEEGCG
jgi:hypothetical protein